MTAAEFRAIRQRLGLSINDMARVLDVRPDYVRHMELGPDKRSRVPVSGPVAKLMTAYSEGYRPKEWPDS